MAPESNAIFDLITDLYKACNGRWTDWIADGTVTQLELLAFLDYAAIFLNNIGNYFADGGRKIVPDLSADALLKLAKHSGWTDPAAEDVIKSMLSTAQSSLGYPSETSQANYYPEEDRITREEIALVSRAMEMHRIEPENTRILKRKERDKRIFEVLQASKDARCLAEWDQFEENDMIIRILGGDHNDEMAKICDSLEQAKMFSSNENQIKVIDYYITSFKKGRLQAYRDSKKIWVKDQSPVIETTLGFVEPYRDPHSVRGEWQSIVFTSDSLQSLGLKEIVRKCDHFLCQMPWAVADINSGKGPFEKDLFDPPDFVSVHGQYEESHELETKV
ncbi:uncharacterized protein N7483_006392 [Penicillium malachiteum]|uniref:uncharacterized protein n=1 Tax=Penicillium malachiteum TaxID=1324776 RepID=UPI0025492C9F|nr:uncharacterized protein N7483_006392 [Penicillium malachiteum]KAJ5725035.1 hypothetical protein N7483_006392 [Penicillium malachiteum]